MLIIVHVYCLTYLCVTLMQLIAMTVYVHTIIHYILSVLQYDYRLVTLIILFSASVYRYTFSVLLSQLLIVFRT